MQFDEVVSYLLSLGHETLTIKLGLTNTERLLEALGNPQQSFLSVQIAGTNGKGSTAVMLDAICHAAGIRTGLFTSPHLISITERIKIGGVAISENDFARIATQVRSAAEDLVSGGELETLPTFFEHVTAMALLAFHEANVEMAILETGLGGRLDSTTAARAKIVAITPIAMDHEEYLGHTIEEIAFEKAAIIKPGTTAIIGPQDESALRVILKQCAATNVAPQLVPNANEQSSTAPYRSRIGNAGDGRFRVTCETPHDSYDDVLLGLRGRHQVDNAMVAIGLAEALRELDVAISHDAIVNGLTSAKHAGRLELWEGRPPILFDGAHNAAAALALRDYLDEFVTEPITIIFGAMRDKPVREMAALLFPRAHNLILTEFDNPRAATFSESSAAVPDEFDRTNAHQALSIDEAIGLARDLTGPDELILITGSLYLIGSAQETLTRAVAGVSFAN